MRLRQAECGPAAIGRVESLQGFSISGEGPAVADEGVSPAIPRDACSAAAANTGAGVPICSGSSPGFAASASIVPWPAFPISLGLCLRCVAVGNLLLHVIDDFGGVDYAVTIQIGFAIKRLNQV